MGRYVVTCCNNGADNWGRLRKVCGSQTRCYIYNMLQPAGCKSDSLPGARTRSQIHVNDSLFAGCLPEGGVIVSYRNIHTRGKLLVGFVLGAVTRNA